MIRTLIKILFWKHRQKKQTVVELAHEVENRVDCRNCDMYVSYGLFGRKTELTLEYDTRDKIIMVIYKSFLSKMFGIRSVCKQAYSSDFNLKGEDAQAFYDSLNMIETLSRS